MTTLATAPPRTLLPATLPPAGLPGLDPSWSRLVTATDGDGVRRTWHVLDTGGPAARGTLLCVHGNPTWSYLWRHVLAAAPTGWRAIAVDQLGMGWSERPDAPRTLAQRITDLSVVVDALDVDGPVTVLAHDWGGPIALGWALAHRSRPGARLAGVVLANTAVHQPAGAAAPSVIRLARTPALRETVCVRTPAFVRSATALSHLPRAVRDAYAAPYASAARRRAVGDFVADIPLEPDHPSAAALDDVAARIGPELADVPVLLLWGPRDPVFSDRYLRDLTERLPDAEVHRYETAAHLVPEDAPGFASTVWSRCALVSGMGGSGDPSHSRARSPHERPPLWAALAERAGDPSPAVVEPGGRTISWDVLERRVRELAAGLAAVGVRPGHRVALLVPPGADLTAAVYASWRAGASIVVADAGLGVARMGRALRGAAPDHVIGIPRGLALARAAGVPGTRIAAGPVTPAVRRAVGAEHGLADLARLGRQFPLPPEPDADAEAAVLFTSGATGPPKGVVYRHRQLQAQAEVVRETYGLGPGDRLVAAFAPFALYGPALGIASAVPDVDVTAPGTLTAAALADAVSAVDATVVFASPAGLRGVVRTADGLDDAQRTALGRVRLLMSAGAPVPASLLRSVVDVLPAAEAHTPYGMTEALPVTDVSLCQIEEAGEGDGVCVGRPVTGVELRVSPLGADGPLTDEPGVTGEVCVRAEHVKDRYDRLWATEQRSSRDPGWHRTGDVGHLDGEGRLWVEGRLAHVVVTADGVVTPVGVEQRVEALPAVRAAAVVGVGPRGTQQVVVVVVRASGEASGVLAAPALTAAVRSAAGVPVAAVLTVDALPVDIRHQSKVDRAAVAAWAERVLAGARVSSGPAGVSSGPARVSAGAGRRVRRSGTP